MWTYLDVSTDVSGLTAGGEGKPTREYNSKVLLVVVTSSGSIVGDGMKLDLDGDGERGDTY